jgi:hypothetical protein
LAATSQEAGDPTGRERRSHMNGRFAPAAVNLADKTAGVERRRAANTPARSPLARSPRTCVTHASTRHPNIFVVTRRDS